MPLELPLGRLVTSVEIDIIEGVFAVAAKRVLVLRELQWRALTSDGFGEKSPITVNPDAIGRLVRRILSASEISQLSNRGPDNCSSSWPWIKEHWRGGRHQPQAC